MEETATNACIKNDCKNIAVRQGYCRRHYDERKNGVCNFIPTLNSFACGKKVYRNGLCRKHYRLYLKSTKIQIHCSKCLGEIYSDNLCLNHYIKENNPICIFEGCEEKIVYIKTKSCRKHYKYFIKDIDYEPSISSPSSEYSSIADNPDDDLFI